MVISFLRPLIRYRIFEILKSKGICYIWNVTLIGLKYCHSLILYYFKYKKNKEIFLFQERTYTYFYHPWSPTWENERCVEIPIIREYLLQYRLKGKKILEVGNVLSNYFPVTHDILDKYEKAKNVINQDIVTFKSHEKYNLIVSISTLEHVGWDEIPKEPIKILSVIKNMIDLLEPEGKIVVTLPLGYNPEMDKLIKEDKIHFTQAYYMKRISSDNRWMEVKCNDIVDIKYNEPFPYANGLIVGVFNKDNLF